MKKNNSSKEIYNAAFPNLILNERELKTLQKILLGIVKDIDALCRKHGIMYMLGGGSCLGAVRHNGFIPWDDDVDIIMYKYDMLKLHVAICEDFSEKYISVLPYMTRSPDRMMKVFLKGTVYKEIEKENMPCEHKIFVDVFPVVNMPVNECRIIKNDKKHYFASRLFSLCHDSKYLSNTIIAACKTNKELKKYYYFRRRFGRLARLVGIAFWRKRTRDLETGVPYVTGKEGIPCGISYKREVFPSGFFSEVIEADFEDTKLFIPKEYDVYLKNLYGDYMQIPPEEKRIRHMVLVMNFGMEK